MPALPSAPQEAMRRCQCRQFRAMPGSVFPQALLVAVPNFFVTIALAVVLRQLYPDLSSQLAGSQVWSSYNLAMGLLLVFRTQQAYSRWWEGSSLLQMVRGEWYNATSSLIAFCNRSESKRKEVQTFQHLIVRLMSMLYCSALQQIAMMDDASFEVIDGGGVSESQLAYLRECDNRCDVLLQWIQRLVVKNMDLGVLDVPAPVMTRVFHELSRGMVHHTDVKKMRQPFPFPYAQMVTFLLMIHWLLTPVVNCLLVEDMYYSALLSFVSVFAFWSINYVAVEIEMPFGDDANDLPIASMQRDMNRSLLILLDHRTQEPPDFDLAQSFHLQAKCRQTQKVDALKFQKLLSASWPAAASPGGSTPRKAARKTRKRHRRSAFVFFQNDVQEEPSRQEVDLWTGQRLSAEELALVKSEDGASPSSNDDSDMSEHSTSPSSAVNPCQTCFVPAVQSRSGANGRGGELGQFHCDTVAIKTLMPLDLRCEEKQERPATMQPSIPKLPLPLNPLPPEPSDHNPLCKNLENDTSSSPRDSSFSQVSDVYQNRVSI